MIILKQKKYTSEDTVEKINKIIYDLLDRMIKLTEIQEKVPVGIKKRKIRETVGWGLHPCPLCGKIKFK